MSRPKAINKGKVATGIQEKKGYLYIVISKPVIKDGMKTREKRWIKTGLKDTEENRKKAIEKRLELLDHKVISVVDKNILVPNYTKIYMEKKKRVLSATTYAAYHYRIKKIDDYFREIRVKDLTEKDIEAFLDYLFETYHIQRRTVKDLKVLFGNIIESAMEDGILSNNPVRAVKISQTLANKYAKDKNPDETFFSYEEARLFLRKVKEITSDPKNKLQGSNLYQLFYVVLFFGLRREELLGLRWSSIDLRNGEMSIDHTVTKGLREVSRTNSTKTKTSARKYPLTEEQVKMFKEMKRNEEKERKEFGNSYYDNDYIFKNADGKPFYPDYPSKVFKKLIRKIPELPQDITLHGLRTSCISILVYLGMDVKSIQKWVGHKDIDTTLRVYARVKDRESKKEVSERMKELILLDD